MAFEAGIDDYLRKESDPSHYQVLARRIRTAVEKYNAERSLHEREQELSSMIENFLDAIFRVEIGRGVTRYNSAFMELFGFSHEEIQEMGMGVLELIYEGDRAQFKQELGSLFSLKLGNYSSLNRWRRKNGDYIWFDSSISVLVEEGKFVGVDIIAKDVSQRMKMEREFRESEGRYRSLFESMGDGVAVYEAIDDGEDFVLVDFNPAGERIGRMQKKDVIGKKATEIFPSIKRMGLFKVFQRVWRTGKSEKQPTSFYKDDRLERWVENSVSKLSSGEIVAVYQDNTERKRIEEDLRDSELKYRSLFESTSEGIIITGPETEIISANQEATEILGYSKPEEVIGLSATQFYVDIEDRAELLRKLREERTLSDYEVKIRRKDGAHRTVQTSFSIHTDQEGNLLRMASILRDITEHVKVKEDHERLFKAVELTKEAASIQSSDLIIVYANGAMDELFGYEKGELIGKHVSILNVDATSEATIREVVDVVEKEGFWEGEVQNKRKDGTEFITYAITTAIKDEEGKIQSVITTQHDITERKRMEDEVREIGEQYKTLFDSLVDDVLVIDPKDYSIIKVNNTALNTLKMTEADTVGKYCYEVTLCLSAPCEAPSDICPVKQTLETGEPTSVEHTHYDVDGNPIYVEVSSSPVKDEEGNIVQIIHLSRDVSERVRLMDGIKKSEERLELMFEYAPDAIYLNDLRGNFIDGNRAAEKLTGYTREEIIGKSFLKLNLLSRRQLPKAGRLLAQNVMGQSTGPDDFTITRKNGEQVSVEISTYPVKLRDGTVVIGIARDITERKKMEERLRESEETLRNIFDSSPDAITISGLEGNIVECNQATLDIHGFSSKDEVIGRSALELIAERDHERAMENLKRTMEQGLVRDVEYMLLTMDGREFPGVLSASVILDASSNPLGFTAITRDITERNRMEEEIRKHTEYLEASVEEKTLELLDAERMVTAGRIASMVGHDLKSPLQTIRNAAHLLREVPEQKDEILDMIENSVMRANRLIEDFRSNVRDTPLMLVTVDLGALIEAAVVEAGISDSVSVALNVEGVEAVSLDPSKMHRVLDNLIGNAVEAMPEGGSLKITAGRREKEVVIEVTDTGVGISEEELPDLFKSFHTTKPRGLGLGLTFCKRAVEAHEGSISVESKVGEETTFMIRLPHAQNIKIKNKGKGVT